MLLEGKVEYKELSLSEKQKVSLEILVFVHSFCESHNIRYYLAYGTLLGAIRHQGFIPWDDDVDIFVPRSDYDRLSHEFTETPEYKLVTCFNTKGYCYPFAKVMRKNTKMLLPSGKIYDQGIGIDLFPVDGIPNTMDLDTAKKIFEKENNVFIELIANKDLYKFSKPDSKKNRAKLLVYDFYEKFNVLQNRTKKICIDPYGTDYDECERVASVVGLHSGKFRPYPKKWFEPAKVVFEGVELIAPSGYEEILRMIYGDYMKLPPEEKRETTHLADYIWV